MKLLPIYITVIFLVSCSSKNEIEKKEKTIQKEHPQVTAAKKAIGEGSYISKGEYQESIP